MQVRLRAALFALATMGGLGACSGIGALTPQASLHPSTIAARVSATPKAAPIALPTPSPVDATYVGSELGAIEPAIRSADTTAAEYVAFGQRQQQIYHLLSAHPDWLPTVLGAVSPPTRATIQANVMAAQQIDNLNGSRTGLPHWRIVTPPAPEVLLGYYREAQHAFGIPWQYLAAINLIETNMGRIQGLSSAGAQGPMQFMPATWAAYGRGDVNDPRDAILAAGRYLQAAGAARNLSRAIYAYNNSDLYVRAVTLYAQQMIDNERAFFGYYNWQVYVATTAGEVLLPEGFSG